jgi:hypothetical protein
MCKKITIEGTLAGAVDMDLQNSLRKLIEKYRSFAEKSTPDLIDQYDWGMLSHAEFLHDFCQTLINHDKYEY